MANGSILEKICCVVFLRNLFYRYSTGLTSLILSENYNQSAKFDEMKFSINNIRFSLKLINI